MEWVALIISVLSAAAAILLRPKAPATPDQKFTGPTAEAGGIIPVGWGVFEIAPNTTWWGRLQRSKRKQYFYSISQHVLLCWGVLNEIIDISFANKSCRNHVVDGDQDVVFAGLTNAGERAAFTIAGNIHARTAGSTDPMFGGDEQGGGVGADLDSDLGEVMLYWGFDGATKQPIDETLASDDIYGAQCSRWPGFAHLRMGTGDSEETAHSFYIAAGSGTPPAMKLLVRRTAWWEDFDTGGLSPLGQTASEATLGYDANPAEILYDLLTNKGYGIGRPAAGLDVASFVAVAQALRDEVITAEKTGFGISLLIASEADSGQVIQNILKHIDATLCTNPVTGLLRLKLIRADYDVETLPRINASNSSGHRYSPSTWAETVNEVQVKYRRFVNTTDLRGLVDDIASFQDLANWQATAEVRNAVFDLPYITDPDTAALCASRRGRAGSVPLGHFSCTMNREGYGLMPGDPVLVEESAFGIADVVARVVSADYGKLEDGKIQIDAVQDVFGVTHATYTPPAPGSTEPTSTTTDDSGSGSTPAGADGVDWFSGYY